MGLRGMDDKGKFIQEEDSRADAWKYVAKSDRLVKRYAGDIFAETRLDDGLHAIVTKDSTSEERLLVKQQKIMGAVAHLTLLAKEVLRCQRTLFLSVYESLASISATFSTI